MTRFLVTQDNPTGWRLEDILTVIQDDIIRRCGKIVGDQRPEARRVLHNNMEIMTLLTRCIEHAQDSTRVLRSLGPEPGPHEPPRIGVA
jgi:hypothetical protein